MVTTQEGRMVGHKHKFTYGKHWNAVSLEQYETNCRLLMEYHGFECPDNVDWKTLKKRFCACDAAHYIMGDWREKDDLPPLRREVLPKRVYEGTRFYGGG